jgi:hypothetical protein
MQVGGWGGHAPRRFLTAWAVVLVTGVAGAAATNVLVDPYDLWRLVVVPGVPHRPMVEGHDRMHKARLLRTTPADVVVLGTSRPQVMIDPDSPRFVLSGLPEGAGSPGGARPVVVNAAVNGARPYDVLRLYQHERAHHRPKLVIVALDPLSFDAGGRANPEHREERFAVDVEGRPQRLSAWADVPAAVLSLDAVKASAVTLRRRDAPSYVTRHGQRDPAFQRRSIAKAGGQRALFAASEREYLGGYACLDLRGGTPEARPPATPPFDDLRRFLALARDDGAVVRLFVSPVHARHLLVLEEVGLAAAFDRWRADLAALVVDMRGEQAGVTGFDVTLTDFTGLAFDEEVPPADADPSREAMRWWWESSHAAAALGEVVLARLLPTAPHDGVAGDVAQPHAGPAIWAALAAWKASHPIDVAEVRAAAAEVLAAARRERACEGR